MSNGGRLKEISHLRVAYDRALDRHSDRAVIVRQLKTFVWHPANPAPANHVKLSVITPRYVALALPLREAMNTVQANVRVLPEDRPLVRAIAVRLRRDPHFRERLKAYLEEDSSPSLAERIERLEQQMEQLLNALNESRSTGRGNLK